MDNEVVLRLYEVAHTAREGAEQFIPIVFWANMEGQVAMILAPHGQSENLATAIGEATEFLRDAEGFPMWVGVAVDAYGRVADTDDDGEPISAGELDKRFKSGDARVVEQIMVFHARPFAPTRVYRQVYRHTATDGWEWDDIELILEPVLPDHALLKQLRLAVSDPPSTIGNTYQG